jgi:hypothetical protein
MRLYRGVMMHRRYGFLPAAALLITLVVAVLLPGESPTANATTFEPTLDATVSDAAPSASADVTYDFQILAPDANFADIVAFLPQEFEIAADADVPDGAIAGLLRADATLGLINGSCSNHVPVEMTLYEATTDLDDWWYGYDGYEDVDGNGVVEFAQHAPYFLHELFPGVQPIQRIYGQASVVGTLNMVNFLIFAPGTPIPFFPRLDESLGYPMFAFLNSPYEPLIISPISDFCSPLGVINTTYGVSQNNPEMPGDQGGYALRTNPPADGTYVATSFVRSLWDADDDGIESNLDPCHYEPDSVWDPRDADTAGDADGDGLPATCDPDDNSWDQDVDGDGYVNRLDLCPFVYDYAFDRDADDVGDACDRDPFDASDGGLSHQHAVCTTSLIVIGADGDDPDQPPCPDGPNLPAVDFYTSPETIAVGSSTGVVVTLRSGPNSYEGPSGVTVNLTVEGVNAVEDTCITDEHGSCHFSYVGTAGGQDIITVSVPDINFTGTSTVTWDAPPPNDRLENAIVIDDVPYEGQPDTHLAGTEDGEIEPCGYYIDATVWYRYTATADGMLDLTVQGAFASVFTGDSVASLEPVICSEGGHHYFFEAEAGTDYYIRVEDYPFGGPGFDVSLTLDAISGISVGDMNCDGAQDVVDSLIILRIDAGLPVPNCATAYGDLNCDGEVNPIDSIILLYYDANPTFFVDQPFPGCLPIGWSG